MKKALAFADRASMPLLKLMSAIHMLFLLAFIATIMITMKQARADEPVCKGKNLLTEIEATDPALFARIRAEADKTENGKGLLWKVEKDGVAPSYLFGTMHVTDKRVTTLTPAAQSVYDASSTVVLETTDVLDQKKLVMAMMSRPDLTMFTDNTTLTSLLPARDVEGVKKALDERGIPPVTISKMKPWVISTMLSLPACELKRKQDGAAVLDVKLGTEAQAKGKKLAGLETAISQLEAMASLPLEFHVQGLIDTLKLGDRIDDINETMIDLYAKGDVGALWPLFQAVSPKETGEAGKGYAEFERTMVTTRNKIMVTNAKAILDEGNAFIAVGALHLPGPEGVVALLRKEGYRVTRADQG